MRFSKILCLKIRRYVILKHQNLIKYQKINNLKLNNTVINFKAMKKVEELFQKTHRKIVFYTLLRILRK